MYYDFNKRKNIGANLLQHIGMRYDYMGLRKIIEVYNLKKIICK
jgi:hypothetical protein